ncbi:MAG: HEAT repeat domain-containing protein [Terriglobales bacterium]
MHNALKVANVLLLSACLFPSLLRAQVIPQAATKTNPKTTLAGKAWGLLLRGTKEKGADHRASAVRALSLLRGERRAVVLATQALSDPKPEVRTAAATALWELHATSSIPYLKQALSDKELTVVLAAAHSLLTIKDTSAYEEYYAILTGSRKGGGLISDQFAILKDPRKMALLGLREGIGYIPFGDIGYSAVRSVTKDSSAPVRAAAAKVLDDDPDPVTQNMLAQVALSDKSELVRIAALEAVAKRGDPSAIEKIEDGLNDPKYAVRYAAAAGILHLDDISRRKKRIRK